MVYQCVGCEMMSLQPLGLKSPKNDDWKFSLPSGIAVSEICIHCGHKFRVRNISPSTMIYSYVVLEFGT